MRKFSVNTFLTLDGVMQAPGGRDEDSEGGFADRYRVVRIVSSTLGRRHI